MALRRLFIDVLYHTQAVVGYRSGPSTSEERVSTRGGAVDSAQEAPEFARSTETPGARPGLVPVNRYGCCRRIAAAAR